MPNSSNHSLLAALKQNWLLAGLTAINLSIVHADRLLPVIAKQPASETAPAIAPEFSQFCQRHPSHQIFVRTELFFGLGKPNGSEVTAAEFQQFLADAVTPQFPDGLTVLSGRGQFQDGSGRVVKEPATVLILVYPLERSPQQHQKIEQIRNAYKTAFHQQSVLRTDGLTCVSF